MDTRDLLDEIIFDNDNMKSLFEILNDIFVKFDVSTTYSKDRKKVLRTLDQLSVIIDVLVEKNNMIYKRCSALYDKVIKLETVSKNNILQ